MRKRILTISLSCLALGVLIAILVLSCSSATVTQTNIDVKATLDGSPWTGAVQYTLTLPGATAPTIINGVSVPTTHRNVNAGSWTCAYVSGGPAGASFVNITPSATQSLAAGSTITFTLNFSTTGAGLDHFKCYWFHNPAYTPQSSYYVGEMVELEDQFNTVEARVQYAEYFCNPAKKTYNGEVTEIENDDHHLTLYGITIPATQNWVVDVNNQFGEQTLHVSGPTMLAVPTQKEGHNEPEGLDHFLLYWVYGGQDLNVVVQLEDQFNLEPDVTVYRPVAFANPVQKTTQDGVVTEIENDAAHLVFYEIIEDETFQGDVDATNQFHTVTVSMPQSTRYINMLAVPSQKISYGPPPSLDHFKFYEVTGGQYVDEVLPKVEDQFYTGIEEVKVWYPRYFGNPVTKTYAGTTTSIGDEDHHLMLYDITTPTTQTWLVEVDNQFGSQELTVSGPVMLAAPTQKEEHNPPVWLDHYLLYKVIEGEDVQVIVDLEDQWHKESDVEVHRPVYFANPAGKIPPGIDWSPGMPLTLYNSDDHMVLYEIVGETYQGNVGILNQFLTEPEMETISISDPELLAVPSEKVSFEEGEPEPLVDHFLSYMIMEAVPLQAYVYLEDQFCTVEGTVDWPWLFCNPTQKLHNDVLTPVSYPDHHLTVYAIHTVEEPQHWFVNVNNQFGTQPLTVYGPVALAVPTQKIEPGGHEPPAGLDHYMLYEVIEGPYFDGLFVGLDDQFHDVAGGEVLKPVYFANPVQKTDETGLVTEIVNDQTHQVFYEIIAGQYYYQGIIVANQFGEQTFDVADAVLLTVPSQKISWEELEFDQ